MGDFLDEYFTGTYQSDLGSQWSGHGVTSTSQQRVMNDNYGDRRSDSYGYGGDFLTSHPSNAAAQASGAHAAPPRPPPLRGGSTGVPQQLAVPSPRPLGASGRDQSRTPTTTLTNSSGSPMGTSGSSMLPHAHTDTYETTLPAEAMGAQHLVEYVFNPDAFPGSYSLLSPPDAEWRSKPEEIGIPLPLPVEPVNPQTGRRLVYFGRGQPPVPVIANRKPRFIAVALKPLIPSTAASNVTQQQQQAQYTTSYGTVLGYSDDNTQIIWQERSERFASRLSLSDILMIHRSSALQCKHCGQVQVRAELREHIRTHKKGTGEVYGLFTDEPTLGRACGDTGLLQRTVHPRKLGEGAQGVVELCDVQEPTAEEEAKAGPGSEAYHHQSRHLTPEGSLTKVVVKTLHFDTEAEAVAQYQKSARFMTVMENPHLVEYLAVQLLPDHRTLKLVMPFYSEGDLSTAIRDSRGRRFDETFICSIALQLSAALSFLHERNPPIVHGDIKVENVMFYNNKEQIVLMDLDASREVLVTQRAVRTALGTAAYMAPETMNNERLMPASDMWSLGVLLYVLTVMPQFPMIVDPSTMEEVMLNAPSWASPEDQRAINEFLSDTHSALAHPPPQGTNDRSGSSGRGSGGRMSLGECVRGNIQRKGYSKQLTQLISDLLSYNPWKRPTAEEVGERLTEIMMNNLLNGQ